MSRDLPLDDDRWATEPTDEASVLDRAIVLPFAAGRWALVAIAASAALLLRLVGLDRWPLSISGANAATDAYRLVHGEGFPRDLHGVTTTVEWAALAIFAGGANDAIVRVGFAVAGIAAVLLWLALIRPFGWEVAASGLVLSAFSPTLVVAARTVDGAVLVLLGTMVVLISVIRANTTRGIAWPAIAGVATALMVLAHPFGVVAAVVAWLGALLVAGTSEDASPQRGALALPALASGLLTLVLTTTVLLTRPGSLPATLGELLRRLWQEHLSEAGSLAHLLTFNLILNEPLLLLLGAVALVAARGERLTRAAAIWLGVAFLVASVFGAGALASWTMVVVPLTLLASTGAAYLAARLPWGEYRRGPATIYMLAVLLMVAAGVSLIGLLAGGTGSNTVDWLLRFVLVVLVAIVPLAFALSALGRRMRGDRLVIVLAAAMLLFGGLTVRSSVLAASERPGDPGDPLARYALSADIPIVVGRLERLSRDLTMAQRDSRDPAGGHGLRIAIDSAVAQPFAWYFRDYPRMTIFDPATETPPADVQVVILDGSRDAGVVAPGLTGQTYQYGHDLAPSYAAPDWAGIASSAFSIDGWRHFAGVMIDRSIDNRPAAQQFQVLATPDIANSFFQATGPFNLSDRVGAGSAEGQLNGPRGVAVGADGSIYVVDSRNARVQQYGPDGVFIRAVGSAGSGPGQLGLNAAAGGGGPNGLAIADDGSIFVADTWNHRITVFAADGAPLRTWGQFADLQDSADAQQQLGSFYGPRGIVIHGGLVYVTDTGNERVQVFDQQGTLVRAFGGAGDGDGKLREPVGIAVAADGTILVADSHNGRIARFNADGSWRDAWPVAQWAGLQYFEPWLALGDDGTTYATTSTLGEIVQLDSTGREAEAIGKGTLRQPFGVAVSPGGGSLLVADGALQTVLTVPLAPR